MPTRSSNPSTHDPFAELGLAPSASRDEVRRAFRRRARETHPDHRPDDPHAAQNFARLRAAYEEALARVEQGQGPRAQRDRHDTENRTWTREPHMEGEGAKRRYVTEHELETRAEEMRDRDALRRLAARHGQRTVIAAALARNPHLPTDVLPTLLRLTDDHWTVQAAIATRVDAPHDLLLDIARVARETVIGQGIVHNERATGDILDALVYGPIRLDAALEGALAARADLSTGAATRLATRYATNTAAVVRLVERGDLPEELLRRLAGQSGRAPIAAAARRDLLRRGLPVPPGRGPQRPPKTMTGYWR